MSDQAMKDLLLVGSVPLETSEEVFCWVADNGLAGAVSCLPDGEVGERIYWIVGLGYRVYHGHPDIETVRRPAPIDGVENWRARNASDTWSFRVKKGIGELHFGDPGWRLGYARDAINSYFVFKTLREKGLIPADVRFQVCLPLTYSGFGSMFREVDDWPIMAPAYEEAMRAEVAMIVRKIPPRDLAIQWDLCIELGMIERTGAQTGNTTWQAVTREPLDLVGDAIAHLAPSVPVEVMLGYHLCYGTLGGWPMRHGSDLGMAVKAVHAMLERSGRRVDYVHIPILDDAPDAYFAPLRELRAGATKIYLGVIHNVGNVADFKRKLEQGQRYLGDFGISAPCGFGREPVLPQVLKDHSAALKILREMRR
jgi:hypothetical protein